VLTPFAVRSADRIITVSESSREDIIKTYPSSTSKTVAVHNGVTPRDADLRTPITGLTKNQYLLFVGSNNPRKNISGLLRAYRRYRQRSNTPVPLALVGPDNDLFRSNRLPKVDGVLTFGYVSESELAWLYHNASAFVFPSFYEGFGLPILEAMNAGTPVITSDRGAMAEVASDAACLVDPENTEAIATAIERVLNGEYANDLREDGYERAGEFTWERTARETLDVYRELAKS
jgi:glycosyltransferase involved in cell wall biosynthesis